MPGEPGTSTDNHIGESSARPVTPAANSNGGEALSRPALDNSDNGGSVMPAPLTTGETVATPAYIYAIGQIEPRFPTLSAEKEFAQATGRAETAGLSDRRALHAVLSQRENRYLEHSDQHEQQKIFRQQPYDTRHGGPQHLADTNLFPAALCHESCQCEQAKA